MTDLAKLLPPSISGDDFMAAVAQAAGEQEEAARAPISNALIWSRIDELSESILDHLGWGLHIDGWEYADSIEKKRWLIKHFYDWHRLKGTTAGLEMFWRVLIGRTLLKSVGPHRNFWCSDLTAEDRRAYEAPHPELRIYPFRSKADAGMAFFWDQSAWGEHAWMELDPAYQAGLKFELYDPLDGSVTELRPVYSHPHQAVRWARGEIEVPLPGEAGEAFFWDHSAWGEHAWMELNPNEKIYNFNPDQIYLDTSPESQLANPGLIPMSAAYTETSDRLDAGPAFFWGHSAWGEHAWLDLRPEDNLYKAVKLFDPARASEASGTAQGGRMFWGHFTWEGPPAHNAHVSVEILETAQPWLMFWGHFFWGELTAWNRLDAKTPVMQACEVACLAKRLSDRIMIKFENHSPAVCGSGIKCGQLSAGAYVREA